MLPSRVCVLNDYGERKKFHRKKNQDVHSVAINEFS